MPVGKGPLCPLDSRANGCRKSFGRCEKNLISYWESNPPSSAMVNNEWIYTLLPQYACMAFTVKTSPLISIDMLIVAKQS